MLWNIKDGGLWVSVKISGPEKPLGSGDKIDAEDGVNERISRDVWLYLSLFFRCSRLGETWLR